MSSIHTPCHMSTWVPTAYRTHTLGEIQSKGAELIDQEVTVSGFMEANRGKGAICFVDLRDGTGTTQIFLKKDNIGEEELDMVQRMTRESTLQFTGTVSEKRPPKTKEGEPTPPPAYEVIATSVNVIARAEAPLPLGVTDTVHVALDTRLDNRFLDLRRSHVNAMFHLRGKILQYGREALINEGFFETHTPKIVATATEGGTDLFPMMYFDTPAFLNQSPQLFKQLCMSGGLERVFEIGPAFRAEKHDTYRHLNEFISFDIECSWANDDDVMGVLERMIHHMWQSVSEDPESQQHIATSMHIERLKMESQSKSTYPRCRSQDFPTAMQLRPFSAKVEKSNGATISTPRTRTFWLKIYHNSTSYLAGQWNLNRSTSIMSKEKMVALVANSVEDLISTLAAMNSLLVVKENTEWMC